MVKMIYTNAFTLKKSFLGYDVSKKRMGRETERMAYGVGELS